MYRIWMSLAFTILCLSVLGQQREIPFEVHFSLERGLYDTPIQVNLSCPGAKIYYTLDGNPPAASRKNIYSKPLEISKNTVVRAFAVKEGQKSAPSTHSYIIQSKPTEFMVAALTIDPDYLFDSVHGLFVEGVTAKDTFWMKRDANFWARIERLAHIELFDPMEAKPYAQAVGFRIFGGMSRLWPQKSFSVTARNHYGDKRLRHRVFGPNTPKKFKNLVFRNSGSDFGQSHFRDAFMTELVREWDFETQYFRPCHTYINGEYWGIYNIREKINRHFIANHSETDRDSLVLMEHKSLLKFGSKKSYLELLDFLRFNSPASQAAYDSIQNQIDIPNFMDYYIAQIYFGNRDAGGNTRYWKPRTNGKWRWILYDTDAGFGLNSQYDDNSFAFFTEPNGPSWPNPPWSTFLLRKMLENPSFKQRFMRRFLHRLHTDLAPERVETMLHQFIDLYQNDIDLHLNRWGLSKRIWRNNQTVMLRFANNRYDYTLQYLLDFFEYKSFSRITVEAPEGGTIWLDQDIPIKKTLEGKYPTGSSFVVEARPKLGYKFSHWEGSISSKDPVLYFQLKDTTYHLTPVFEPYRHPKENQVVINEICPYSPYSKDWVEIYNHSDNWVDITGWKLEDARRHFAFPKMKIQPNSYVIVAQNEGKFKNTYFGLHNVIPGMPFGINKWKERLTLYADDGAVVDAVSYEQEPLDSAFVRSLLLPNLDNGDDENWNIKVGLGTPGSANPYFLESTIKLEQKWYLRIGITAALLFLFSFAWYLWYVLRRHKNHNFER